MLKTHCPVMTLILEHIPQQPAVIPFGLDPLALRHYFSIVLPIIYLNP